jgi:hypothetical protein
MMIKFVVNEDNWKESLPIVVMHYRDMEMMDPGTPLLHKVRKQYADMARGGDGGRALGDPVAFLKDNERHTQLYPSLRLTNYPRVPDVFFQELCDLIGWDR